MAIGTTTSGQILYVDENAAPSSLEEQIKDTKDLEISYRTLHTIGEIHDINTNRIIKIPFASFFVKYNRETIVFARGAVNLYYDIWHHDGHCYGRV